MSGFLDRYVFYYSWLIFIVAMGPSHRHQLSSGRKMTLECIQSLITADGIDVNSRSRNTVGTIQSVPVEGGNGGIGLFAVTGGGLHYAQ